MIKNHFIKPKKIFLNLLSFLIFSGCLQEASYIENYPDRKNLNSNLKRKNFFDNQSFNKFDDENYFDQSFFKKKSLNLKSNPKNHNLKQKNITTTRIDENFKEEEIIWSNIFDEYEDKKIHQIEKPTKIFNEKNSQKQLIKKNIQKFEEKNNPQKNAKAGNKIEAINDHKIEKKTLSKPAYGQILTKFSKNSTTSDFQDGVSFKAKGENIFACSDGRVIYADNQGETGKTIIIKFDNGIVGSYVFHGKIFVETNAVVKNRQIIGSINLEHGKNLLYFTIKENGRALNPEDYFVK
jgi:septal ring factor EnvC (AmiA/AmiB activator)